MPSWRCARAPAITSVFRASGWRKGSTRACPPTLEKLPSSYIEHCHLGLSGQKLHSPMAFQHTRETGECRFRWAAMSSDKCKVFTSRKEGEKDHQRQPTVSTTPESLHRLIHGKWDSNSVLCHQFVAFSVGTPSQDILFILFILSTTYTKDPPNFLSSSYFFHGFLKFTISGTDLTIFPHVQCFYWDAQSPKQLQTQASLLTPLPPPPQHTPITVPTVPLGHIYSAPLSSC